METTLIEFDENESNDSKETIWDIENNEKLQLASFIENQILTKVQLLFDEKDKQIEELRKTNTYLQNKIDDLTLSLENLIYVGISDIKDQLQDVTDIVSSLTKDVANVTDDVVHVTEDVATVTEDITKHANYLSNSYIYLLTDSWRLGASSDLAFKTNVKEIDFQGNITHDSVDKILWESIENFTELEKLTIASGIMSSGMFTKIKSKTIKELIVTNCYFMRDSNRQGHSLYIHDYIEDILTNIPNLEILEINYRPDICTWINNFVEKITLINHQFEKIKLTINGIGTIGDLTRIQRYCKMKHIELEMA
jgi:hypothetical protein